MLPIVLCTCLALASAAPAIYDQRQDGDFNVQADVKNVVLVVALPQKLPSNIGFGDLSLLLDGMKIAPKVQQRSDMRVMEAFVEPSTPYHVEIGESTRDLGERTVEVVIAGRGSSSNSVEAEGPGDELKLLGATEQCGPGMERDPDTLTCQELRTLVDPADLADPAPAQPEEVQPPGDTPPVKKSEN